jgi:hypothetical protein
MVIWRSRLLRVGFVDYAAAAAAAVEMRFWNAFLMRRQLGKERTGKGPRDVYVEPSDLTLAPFTRERHGCPYYTSRSRIGQPRSLIYHICRCVQQVLTKNTERPRL